LSSLLIAAPGLCSPSRIVVSNMINFSLAMIQTSVSALGAVIVRPESGFPAPCSGPD
jgi:hypothetical protein